MAQDQRRINERLEVIVPVEFRNTERRIAASVSNISPGGMCIKTSEILPVRSQSFFRIVSQNQAVQFHIEAEVVWTQPQSRIRQRRNKRPGMMGVRFIKSRFLTDEMIVGMINQMRQPEPTAA